MKKLLTITALFVLVSGLSARGSRGAQPVDYVVNTKSSIMTIALNGDVRWSESVNGTAVRIDVAGSAKDFIVKRIAYNFRDGAVKSFTMTPIHPDTERITITLRQEQAYRIYQSPSTGRLVLEFLAGSGKAALPVAAMTKASASFAKNAPAKKEAPAAKAASQKKESAKQKTASPARPIDIASLAKESTKNEPSVKSAQTETAAPAPVSSLNASALLLLFASTVIIIGGGIAVGYVLLTRQQKVRAAAEIVAEPAKAPVIIPSVPASTVVALPAEQKQEEWEFEQAVDYAEQYLRTQGEMELQQRLERLNTSSFHTRIERAAAPAVRGNASSAAEKLGVSIGELELANRLQAFQHRHTTEEV